MKIKLNETTYLLTKDHLQWRLNTPTVGRHPKTKALVDGFRETYHMTLGQGLAAIAEKEMGKTENIDELLDIVKTLRDDLLNHVE